MLGVHVLIVRKAEVSLGSSYELSGAVLDRHKEGVAD
jgi:hypothetical protein